MAQEDSVTTRVTVVLDKPSDWEQWVLVRENVAGQHLWKYISPATPLAQLPILNAPDEVLISKFQKGATGV